MFRVGPTFLRRLFGNSACAGLADPGLFNACAEFVDHCGPAGAPEGEIGHAPRHLLLPEPPVVFGLPNSPSTDVQGGQEAAAVAKSVDADEMPEINAVPTRIGGMAHNCDFSRDMRGRNVVAERGPAKLLPRLLRQR